MATPTRPTTAKQRFVAHLVKEKTGQELDLYVEDLLDEGMSWRRLASHLHELTGEYVAPNSLSAWLAE